jgi:hypothetical protein
MMRQLVLLGFLAFLAACSVEVSGDADNPAGDYRVQVDADENGHIFLVTGPDGTRSAARVEGGVSEIMDVNEARLALGEARAANADAGPPEDEQVNITLPGFQLSVAADEEGAGSDRARVRINAGGREVHVDAAGEQTGHAVVQISGASAADVRDFINEAEDLSAETKSQMLAELGLTEETH